MTVDIIAPQLAQEANVADVMRYVTDDHWVLEQKLDGNRVMMLSPGGDYPPTFLTRSGNAYTKKVPQALRDFRFPTDTAAGGIVFDGELIRNGSNDYTYWVFDLPVLFDAGSSTNMADHPLKTRRFMLEATVKTLNPPLRLVPTARTTEEKIALAERALTENFEGLLAKRADSHYWMGGRGPDWLKLKFTTTADVVVKGVRDDGKDSICYEVYDDVTGAPIDVGRASLIGKEKACGIEKGDVVEVRYLYVGANGRLYQPTIMRKRDDKRPEECLWGQLKHVNKKVLESL